MILFWIFYYLLLIFICYLFIKTFKNKFLNFFLVPIIFGIFGSIWFSNPGNPQLAPIISILFLEASIIDSNGIQRLIRPMVSTIFFLEILSLLYYLKTKKNFQKEMTFADFLSRSIIPILFLPSKNPAHSPGLNTRESC